MEMKWKKLDEGIKIFLYIIIGLAVLYLFLLSIFGTTSMGAADLVTGVENSGEHAYFLQDIWPMNLLVTAAVICLIYLCCRFVLPKLLIDQRWISIGLCVIFILAGTVLILSTQMYPISDSSKILRIAEGMAEGHYEEFRRNEGYLWRYPDQLGIILLYYIVTLLAGEKNYIVLQFINLFAAAGSGLIAKQLAELIWGKHQGGWIGIGVELLYYIFAPFLLFTMYVYGTILGFAFSLLAFYMELLLLKRRQWKYVFGAALCIGLAVVFKTNSMVMMVAMILFLLYDAFMEKKKRFPIAGILLILCFQIVFTQGIQGFMSMKSGCEISEGMPKLAWVAMALQNGGSAPGAWNGRSVSMFEEAGYDYEKTNQLAMESIRNSIEGFKEDRSEALLWLGKKMAFQWNNPAFGVAQVLRNRQGEITMSHAMKSLIYGRAYYQMAGIMDYLQTVILAGCVSFFILEDKRRPRETLLPAVAFFGGFVFHMFWEAKSEYVLPYFLMLFPYSVRGIGLLVNRLNCVFQKKCVISRRQVSLIVTILSGFILLLFIFYPTRLIQYTVALHDEPELCILYEETIRENVRTVEMKNQERNIE